MGRRRRGFKLFRGIGRGFQKLGKGIKQTAEKVGKGVKAVGDFGSKVGFVSPMKPPQELIKEAEARGGKRQSFGKQIVSGFTDQATRTFKNLEAPTKLVKAVDPLRNTKLGKAGFSPISVVADVVTGVPQAIATGGRAIFDKDRQKQLREGNVDEIINLALAPTAFIGTGVYSGGAQAVKAGIQGAKKQIVKSGTQYLAKLGTKKLATTTATQATRGLGQSAGRGTARVIRETAKNVPKVAGRFDESLKIVAKPIQDIARSTKVPKQVLTKAQRLKQAKEALKSGQRILKQF